MKKIRLLLLSLTLVISCAEKKDDKLEELQSDDFKKRVADKIAKKIPDYPKFGNKEQKVLAKDIVDIIASELNKTKKESVKRNEKTSNESTAKAKKLADDKALRAKKLADERAATKAKRLAEEKAAAEVKRLAEEKAAEAERLANLDKSREEGEFKDGEKDGLWTVYNKEGLKEKEITYELGVEIKQTFYNDQGIKEKEISIAEDKEEKHTTFKEN